MLQTEIWNGVLSGPPKVGPAPWWRDRRTVSLPLIALALGVLVLLCGALLAVGAYSHHRAELRRAETNRLLGQFRSGPVAASWARLGAAWQAEGTRQDALLAQLAAHNGNDRARIRRDHQLFVLETIQEYRLGPDIEVVRQFVIRLATCVRVGSCDRTVAAAQLGPKLWAFWDQHRHFFQFEYSGVELDAHLRTIAPRPAAPARSPRR
jgi:hypothetical protein